MNIEKLRQISIVYYHASCPDGTMSAMLCAEAFRLIGHQAEFKSLQYGTADMDSIVPYSGQLFVDITPPRDRWEEWKGFDVLVLDHHESSEHITTGLNGVYATNEKHSGAMLAYENVYLPCIEHAIEEQISTVVAAGLQPKESSAASRLREQQRMWREFATLAMIRDTWKNTSNFWDQSHALALATGFEGSSALIERVQSGDFDAGALMALGARLLDRHNRKVELCADNAMTIEVGDLDSDFRYKIALFNTTEKITSDVGNLLLSRGIDVAVGYFYTHEDETTQAIVSLRTTDRISASKVCETLGGGGHARAAGFRIKGAFDKSPSAIVDTVCVAISQTRE